MYFIRVQSWFGMHQTLFDGVCLFGVVCFGFCFLDKGLREPVPASSSLCNEDDLEPVSPTKCRDGRCAKPCPV